MFCAREVSREASSGMFNEMFPKIARGSPLERRHDSIVLLMRLTANGGLTTFCSRESPWEKGGVGANNYSPVRESSSLKFD
jgi:hypothetical protein